MSEHIDKEYVEEIRKLKSGDTNKKKTDKKILFLPRLIVFLFGYVVVFLFTKDPVAIIVIGLMLGLTLFFITWAIQLYLKNKKAGIKAPLSWGKAPLWEDVEEETTCWDETDEFTMPGGLSYRDD